eukprot:762497-Hanusia_phi.AAC.10
MKRCSQAPCAGRKLRRERAGKAGRLEAGATRREKQEPREREKRECSASEVGGRGFPAASKLSADVCCASEDARESGRDSRQSNFHERQQRQAERERAERINREKKERLMRERQEHMRREQAKRARRNHMNNRESAGKARHHEENNAWFDVGYNNDRLMVLTPPGKEISTTTRGTGKQ